MASSFPLMTNASHVQILSSLTFSLSCRVILHKKTEGMAGQGMILYNEEA